MPSVSQAQQAFMGADYARAKEGKKTRSGMSADQLKDFASTPRKDLPRRAKSTVVSRMQRGEK